MTPDLFNKKVAVLATDGFEQSELEGPVQALWDAGAETFIVSLDVGAIMGWKDGDWSDPVEVEFTVNEALQKKFDALVLPGGVINSDKLRTSKEAVEFVKKFYRESKPIAAICHGLQILIDAEAVNGRTVTSYPSIKNDLINAGAEWVNREVVVDNGLVTSRTPDDLPAFNEKLLEEIAEGIHKNRSRIGQETTGLY